MPPSSLDEIVRRNHEIIRATREQIATARKLREMSQNLRQENAGLRELLRENLLTWWSKREHWEDS